MNRKTITYDLNRLTSTYNIDNIYESYKRLEFLEKLCHYINFKKSSVLELGSSSGQITSVLSKWSKKVTAVEGSSKFMKIAKKKLGKVKNVEFHKAYFEKFDTDEKFDCIILHHILEHVSDPTLLLCRISKFLKKNGIIAITVPNSDALSRQLAVKMGLMSSVFDLTENDKFHGHVRVYSWDMLEKQVVKSGYKVIGKHGLSFKLFSDKQNMQMIKAEIIGDDQLRGLWKLADELPRIAGAITVVAKKRN